MTSPSAPETPDPSAKPGTGHGLPEPAEAEAHAAGFGLRPPRDHVDSRCRAWWATQTALWAALPVLVLALLGLLIEPARWWLLGAALVLLVLAVPLALVVPRVRWRIHRWEATDDALYSRTGLLWEEWRAAPLSRIQTVDMDRGPLQRSFGLATISVSTASARGAVRISALDAELATELVQRFTHLTEADDEDAT
ncbi:PH domain-containing protein [Brachybacterium sacelli]|uniref:Membrane protein YdbS with pleckstrin-like domain n=1 Tax=Brachybacterium sacelli TaxID=173364 RepID=A0ABS4X5C4_9MICO|nr:PH domain-containing protein [Brachybacterium sacelli]MBP2383661.1 membrane protein YdbS with pleckstrin-like domain [Brachybacterium sacelli]